MELSLRLRKLRVRKRLDSTLFWRRACTWTCSESKTASSQFAIGAMSATSPTSVRTRTILKFCFARSTATPWSSFKTHLSGRRSQKRLWMRPGTPREVAWLLSCNTRQSSERKTSRRRSRPNSAKKRSFASQASSARFKLMCACSTWHGCLPTRRHSLHLWTVCSTPKASRSTPQSWSTLSSKLSGKRTMTRLFGGAYCRGWPTQFWRLLSSRKRFRRITQFGWLSSLGFLPWPALDSKFTSRLASSPTLRSISPILRTTSTCSNSFPQLG